jgi:predicted nucleotidyltransferase
MHDAGPLGRILKKARMDPEILAVIRFGSTVRGEETRASDVDVCLVLAPSRPDARTLARKRLEYAQADELDVTVFQALPLYIRRRVLKEGRVEFVRDEEALYDVAYRTAQAYEDFKHIYHDYLAEVARG